jgi:hypothetical protein
MAGEKRSLVCRLIPVGTGAVGVLFLILSLAKYGFWADVKGPQSGFYPAIISIGLIGTSILAFVQSFKETDVDLPKENWLVPLGLLCIIVASFVIGMVLSLLSFLVFWLRKIEHSSWKTTIITTAIMAIIVIGVFQLWLGVGFPLGLFGLLR